MNIVEFVEKVQKVKLNQYQKIILENLDAGKKPVLPKVIPNHQPSSGHRSKFTYVDDLLHK